MIIHRLRRNRKSAALRALTQETRLHPSDFVAPLFLVPKKREEEGFPARFCFPLDLLVQEVREIARCGIPAVALFPTIPRELKSPEGREAFNPRGLLPSALRLLKREVPEVALIADIALDAYTTHGHDGIVDSSGYVLNDETVERLAEMSLLLADAGADILAPSDMMDGRIGYIRNSLDINGFQNINLLAYSAKYVSAFYGPYRTTLDSHVAFGDKRGYFMGVGNGREALLEVALDIEEGADIVMVKPALHYLDVIARLRGVVERPLAAFHVSGEYAMLLAGAERGWVEWESGLEEALLSIKRAGADIIFSYGAKEMCQLLLKTRKS